MTKIIRPDLDVAAFASQSQVGERTVFGDKSTVSDDLTVNMSADFFRGWASGLDPVNGFPPMEYFSGEMFTATQLASYLFQMGISEWNINQFYPENARAISASGVEWRSLQDHAGQVQVSGVYWVEVGSINIVKFTASGTYEKPPGLKYVNVKNQAPGGGAGGVDGQGAGTIGASGGGGAAACSEKMFLASELSASETVTIGSKGIGGTGAVDGTNGGTTTFGLLLTSLGGGGGKHDVAGATPDIVQGGLGGSATGGDLNADGSPGQPGICVSASRGIGGTGGDSLMGGGARGGIENGDGFDAVSPGAGGGGARNEGSITDRKGGDGGPGEITLTEYY